MFNLTLLIPLIPLLAFVVIVLVTNPNKKLSSNVAIGGIAISWLISWATAFTAFGRPNFASTPYEQRLVTIPTGSTALTFGLRVDSLTAAMLFMVPFLCLLIFIYASGYMDGDPRYSRFFAYVSLFAAGMLGLVVSDNLVELFIFWELMGVCSYLLIGFWFEKQSAYQAAVKAFMTTRVGDTIMFAGMALLYAYTGSLVFSQIFQKTTLDALSQVTLLGAPAITVIAMLIFGGSVGKSAQFPLHVWLPDAMEGPTPVSALIHAATMVSAGVYLIIRMFPLFAHIERGPALTLVAVIGTFTAVFAATIAVSQNDIKRVLAYSTISQLGYMFAALGIGAYVAAVFHLLTHAFFKALLFLASGSVIHGVEHGMHHIAGHDAHAHLDGPIAHPTVGQAVVAHDEPAAPAEHGAALHGEPPGAQEHGARQDPNIPIPTDAQDMRNMGGLLRRMPRTGWSFILGGLALSGFPLVTAGFWSKDEILSEAYHGGFQLVFWALAVAAFLTAFYTGRQIFMTFFGEPRTPAAEATTETVPAMTVPLMILAVFAVVGGWIGIPQDFPILGAIVHGPFQRYIEAFAEAIELRLEPGVFSAFPLLISFMVALGGLLVAYLVYGIRPMKAGEIDPVARALGPLYPVLRNKYYFDELYHAMIVQPAKGLAEFLFSFDKSWVIDPIVNLVGKAGVRISTAGGIFDIGVVDGIVNGVGSLTQSISRSLRQIQTGKAQNYLLLALVAVLMLLGVYLVFPPSV